MCYNVKRLFFERIFLWEIIKNLNIKINIDDIAEKEAEYYAEQEEKLRKQAEIREESRSIVSYSTIFRIKLYMDNGKEHICQVRGRFESDVIKKLTPQVPEVLVLQDDFANVFACRSEKISAIEFLDDKLED